jgi:DNA-binding transcriptional regulator YbjK
MSDPLSVVASVAGVISLGAATTKLFYHFVSSIIEAPREVQAITSSLYSVNIALCQIQTLLLDLTYASETAAEDLGDLDKSVLCCVASFNLIENWLNSVCSEVTENRLTTKRAWKQVKHVFQKIA